MRGAIDSIAPRLLPCPENKIQEESASAPGVGHGIAAHRRQRTTLLRINPLPRCEPDVRHLLSGSGRSLGGCVLNRITFRNRSFLNSVGAVASVSY
jgi:hypothetical protein